MVEIREDDISSQERGQDQCGSRDDAGLGATAALTTDLVIDGIGGNCPVQAEGMVNGVPFYFRARGDSWTFSVGADPVGVSCGLSEGFHHEEEYGDGPYDAGWMPVDEAEAFIRKGAELYLAALTKAPTPDGAERVHEQVPQPIRDDQKSAPSSSRGYQ